MGDLTTQRLRSPDKKLPVLLTYRLLQRGEEVVGIRRDGLKCPEHQSSFLEKMGDISLGVVRITVGQIGSQSRCYCGRWQSLAWPAQ